LANAGRGGKPVKGSREQNPKVIQDWLNTALSENRSQAKNEKSETYGGDEVVIWNRANSTRGYAPRGKPSVIRLAKRGSCFSIRTEL